MARFCLGCQKVFVGSCGSCLERKLLWLQTTANEIALRSSSDVLKANRDAVMQRFYPTRGLPTHQEEQGVNSGNSSGDARVVNPEAEQRPDSKSGTKTKAEEEHGDAPKTKRMRPAPEAWLTTDQPVAGLPTEAEDTDADEEVCFDYRDVFKVVDDYIGSPVTEADLCIIYHLRRVSRCWKVAPS